MSLSRSTILMFCQLQPWPRKLSSPISHTQTHAEVISPPRHHEQIKVGCLVRSFRKAQFLTSSVVLKILWIQERIQKNAPLTTCFSLILGVWTIAWATVSELISSWSASIRFMSSFTEIIAWLALSTVFTLFATCKLKPYVRIISKIELIVCGGGTEPKLGSHDFHIPPHLRNNFTSHLT